MGRITEQNRGGRKNKRVEGEGAEVNRKEQRDQKRLREIKLWRR